MAVLQTAFDIPDDVFARLVTGEYLRDGGVVRDLAGRLVKLLGDASPVTDAQESARAALAKSLTRPRSVVIGWQRPRWQQQPVVPRSSPYDAPSVSTRIRDRGQCFDQGPPVTIGDCERAGVARGQVVVEFVQHRRDGGRLHVRARPSGHEVSATP